MDGNQLGSNRMYRRNALQTMGAGLVGITGATGMVAAGGGDASTDDNTGPGDGGGSLYNQYEYLTEDVDGPYGSDWVRTHFGAGINIVEQTAPDSDSPYWEYDIDVAGSGYMVNQDGQEPDSGYNWRTQGVIVEELTPADTSVFFSDDPQETGMTPVPDNLPEGTFGAVTNALSLAETAIKNAPAVSWLFDAAELASTMGEIFLDDNDNSDTTLYDWTELNSGGFQHGGHHQHFQVREYGGPISLRVTSRYGGIDHTWELEFNDGFQSITTV